MSVICLHHLRQVPLSLPNSVSLPGKSPFFPRLLGTSEDRHSTHSGIYGRVVFLTADRKPGNGLVCSNHKDMPREAGLGSADTPARRGFVLYFFLSIAGWPILQVGFMAAFLECAQGREKQAGSQSGDNKTFPKNEMCCCFFL